MATYNGSQYTDFQNVNLKGSGTGSTVGFPNTPGALRIKFNGFASTVSIGTATLDQAFAVSFPNKSGTMPIAGTFSVDLPIVASSGYLSTIVTVAGIRVEDGVTLTPQNNGASGALASARGALVVVDVLPGNGNLTINFANVFATATIARTSIYSFTAVR
jgi:hypothetical protein